MSLMGNLEDLSLPDILQIVSLSRKTGVLTLDCGGEQGKILMREGRVIQTVSARPGRNLGDLLVGQGLLQPDDLWEALEVQRAGENREILGTILMRQGLIDEATLEKVVQGQIEEAIGYFLSWRRGTFRFDQTDLPRRGEFSVDPQAFMLEQGIDTQWLLLEGARLADERKRGGDAHQAAAESPAAAEKKEVGPAAPPAPATPAPPAALSDAEETLLRDMLGELRNPQAAGDLGLLILRFAAELMNRAVLFEVREGKAVGLGGFGLEAGGAAARRGIREISLPLDEPSLLATVVQRRLPVRGPVGDAPLNLAFLKELGGKTPVEAVALPLVSFGRVRLVIYGDNLPDPRPVAGTRALEIFLERAGLMLERSLLERRSGDPGVVAMPASGVR
jgi:hypothetical protein